MRAVWHDTILAESDTTEVVEGNHYFPRSSIDERFFAPSDRHSTCAWKGEASYFDVVVGDDRNPGAAWYYPHPKDAAKQIEAHVAFWKGVKVEN